MKLSEYLEKKGLINSEGTPMKGMQGNSGHTMTISIDWEKMDAEAYLWKRQPSGNLEPLYDKIVVETIEGDTVINGLTIPEGSREKPMKGVIVAVGPGKDNVALKVKIGDVILHQKHAGVEVNLEGKDYLLMRETDVFAII